MSETWHKVPLTQVWGDQVKGSWWKAILVVLGYVLLRVTFETRVLMEGIRRTSATPSLEDLQNQSKLMEFMGNAQWHYHLSTLALLIFLLVASFFLGFKFFRLKEVRMAGILWTLKIYALFFVLNLVLSYVVDWIQPNYSSPDNQVAVEALVSNMVFWAAFIDLVILTPITEEIILRGLLMKYVFSLMPVVGAGVSAIIFAFLHSPSNWIDFLIYFVLSAGLTYVYWRSRKLEYSIVFHMLQNFIATMMMQFFS